MFNLLCPKRSIHKLAVALVLQPCKCQALVFLVRNKSDTSEQNWRELTLYIAFEADGQLFQYKRSPFGVTNGVSAFRRAIDEFIKRYRLKKVYAYLDCYWRNY